MFKVLVLFIALFMSALASGQTALTISPTTPGGSLFRGLNNQVVTVVDLSSTTGGTWNFVDIRVRKVSPSPAWNAGTVSNDFTNIGVVDDLGGVVIAPFNPSTCVNVLYTSTSWACTITISPTYTLPPAGARTWSIVVDIPVTAPTTFLQAGFIPSATPNVSLTGGGTATVPPGIIQGPNRQVVNLPPQPAMTLSGTSPTSSIQRGTNDVVIMEASVSVGAGSGSVGVNSLSIMVDKTGGSSWVGGIDDFGNISIVDDLGTVLVPDFDPSMCIGAAINVDSWGCTVATGSYIIPTGQTRLLRIVSDVLSSGTASTLRGNFTRPDSPNTTLPGGGTFTMPAATVAGATRSISAPPQPAMTLSGTSPTSSIQRGTNDVVIMEASVSVGAGSGSVGVNSLSIMVDKTGGSSWVGGIDDFQNVGVYDNLSNVVIAELNPTSCVGTTIGADTWLCTVGTGGYTIPAGQTRTLSLIADVPIGATATVLRGSFVPPGSPNVTLPGGGTFTMPASTVAGAIRDIAVQLPDPLFEDGFE